MGVNISISADIDLMDEIKDQLSLTDIWELQQQLWSFLEENGGSDDWFDFYKENNILKKAQ